MLAAPLQSTSAFDHSDIGTQYRPAKDIQAFNALLPPAIEFVKGSSTGTIATSDGKYQPINAPKDDKSEVSSPEAVAAPARLNPSPFPQNAETKATPQQEPSSKVGKQAQASASQNITKTLYSRTIDMTWPVKPPRGAGLANVGNSCFLNSALQCLLHTSPFLRVLMQHGRGDNCQPPIYSSRIAC